MILLLSSQSGDGRADLGKARRVGTGTATGDGGAGYREGQRATQLSGTDAGERTSPDPVHRSQGEQKSSLKTVAGTDRVHDLDQRRRNFDHSLVPMPGPSASSAACDNEEHGARREESLCLTCGVAFSIEKGKVAVRQAHDVGACRKAIHAEDILRFVVNQIGPAIRIE